MLPDFGIRASSPPGGRTAVEFTAAAARHLSSSPAAWACCAAASSSSPRRRGRPPWRHRTRPATTITLPVSGMTCASCSVHVKRALEETPGVQDASVNLMLENRRVTFDRRSVQPEALAAAVRADRLRLGAAGSEAAPMPMHAEAQDRAQIAEYRDLRRKAVVSLAAAAVGMLAVDAADARAIVHRRASRERRAAIPSWHGPHVARPLARRARCRGSTPSTRDVLSGVLAALTTAVMAWAGRHFYVRAWSAFRHHAADMNTLVAVGTGAAFRLLGRSPRWRRSVSHRRRRRPGRLLRGGALHHRAHPRRQHVRGPREARRRPPPCARWPTCSRRRRASSAAAATWTSPWRRW